MYEPSWQELHRIGAEIVKSVPGVRSFEEIRAEMGFRNRQEAYHVCCVAVGKLAYRLRRIDAAANDMSGEV